MIPSPNAQRISSTLLGLAVAALCFLPACDSAAPPEAHNALNAALTNLVSQNDDAFIASVLPAQQPGAMEVEQWSYFQAVLAFEINEGYDLEVSDEGCKIMTTMYFSTDREVFGTLYVVMKYADGWYIDLDETIRSEIAKNGSQAFQGWTLEIN